MRIAIVAGLALAGVVSAVAQDYQSPAAPLPTTVTNPIDTSPATQGATTLPANPETARAQTPPATAQTPPASASTQQK